MIKILEFKILNKYYKICFYLYFKLHYIQKQTLKYINYCLFWEVLMFLKKFLNIRRLILIFLILTLNSTLKIKIQLMNTIYIIYMLHIDWLLLLLYIYYISLFVFSDCQKTAEAPKLWQHVHAKKVSINKTTNWMCLY